MRRTLVTAEYVHGKTGLDGPDLPDPKQQLEAQHGVDYIIDTLRHEPEKTVTLCALGPLTNLAMAFVKAPDIVPRVEQIVLMGGGLFEGGNTTPAAEFNIYVDPEAADVVFHSGIPITQVAARRHATSCWVNKERVERFRTLGNRTGVATARDARVLRALRRGQVWLGRRPAARPLRHRLSAEAGVVQGQARAT